MLSKTQVKYIQSLYHKKFREEYGHFVVEGPKMAEEAIRLWVHDILHVYAGTDWMNQNADAAVTLGPLVTVVTDAEMQRVSSFHTPSDVLVVMRKPVRKQPANWDGITLLLDGIQDPGNLGTIIRTADWFGVKKIVCGEGTADCYNPKVIQATMGSIFRVDVHYEDLHSLVSGSTIPVLAASLDGSPLHHEEKFTNAMLVIGNESQGIQPELLEKATRKILIPGQGGAESLNAAVATGILLYAMSK